MRFEKVKTEHTILKEFKSFLLEIEKNENIKRIIPGRIDRQQKSSSDLNFRITIPTISWLKCIMSKWATAQELFIICSQEVIEELKLFLSESFKKYKWI